MIAAAIGLLSLLLAGLAYVGVPWIYTRWRRRALAVRCREERAVVLTFDDGPGPCLTPRLLQALAAAEARGTFFLLGANAERAAPLVEKIASTGNTIGCHGNAHVHHWKCAPWTAVADIREGWRKLSEITGSDASKSPFRPPYGKLNLVSLVYLLYHRTPIAMWTVDGGDTWGSARPEPASPAERLRERAGGVLLLHDFDREGDSRVGDYVVACARSALALSRDGYRLAQLDEVL